MTRAEAMQAAFREAHGIPRNDPDAAAEFYCRTVRARLEWNGLATRLVRMQDDADAALALMRRLAQIHADEGGESFE